MSLEKRLAALEAEFTKVTAKQMAMDCVIASLVGFIDFHPLVQETVLMKEVDSASAAMQQDESADALLPAFLAEISAWQDRLAECEGIQQWISEAKNKKD